MTTTSIVRPGSFCTPGSTGRTAAGTPMACTSPDGKRARMRRAGPTPRRLPAAPGAVTMPGGPSSTRRAGGDRTDAAIADLNGQQIDYEGRRRATHDTPYDAVLAHVATLQGFDAHPQVATREQVDAAVAAGWTEVWRGVQEGTRTAAEINGDLRTGPFQPGRGIYGNGVYTSTRRMTAETFRGRDPKGNLPTAGTGDFTTDDLDGSAGADSLLRIAIDPAANVVDYDRLVAEQTAWVERNGAALRDTAAGRALTDPGRFAAARGYDAIRVVNHADGGFYPGWEESDDLDGLVPGWNQADQFVVLNRSIMMIQRPEDQT